MWRGGTDDPGLVGEDHGLGPVPELELARIAATWLFTVASPTTRTSAISALLMPACEQPEHLAFPCGQGRERGGVAGG